eukprot:Seg802.11 transcript_id=Seg802.11/GoldUCD/mRNA.D3Y31 product="hypothetical protein" protein_id=Seg802.11/GoldUCD/D3Y31
MEGENETKRPSQNNDKSADVFELRKLGTALTSTKDTTGTKNGQAHDDTLLEKAKLKTKDKVVSVWNNVKYGKLDKRMRARLDLSQGIVLSLKVLSIIKFS